LNLGLSPVIIHPQMKAIVDELRWMLPVLSSVRVIWEDRFGMVLEMFASRCKATARIYGPSATLDQLERRLTMKGLWMPAQRRSVMFWRASTRSTGRRHAGLPRVFLLRRWTEESYRAAVDFPLTLEGWRKI
jgi:hypothetical protein